MATTVAEPRRRIRRDTAGLLVLTTLACAHLERAGPLATVAPPEAMLPRIRVGLVVGAPRATVGGGAALRLSTPDGTPVGRIAAGASASVTAENGAIRVQTAGFALAPMQIVVVTPEDSGHVRVEGREYRGALDLVVTDRGLVVANRVSVEDYLPGVVNAEMGRRAPEELAALAAQAVISRTVAVRAIGRAPARGYDLLATVADQAYLGIAAELPQGREAVEATRGLVLTHLGQPIDAFFHSTCGGSTAEPTEIFVGGGGRPYLTSVSDRAPDGRDYCAISPRHRWREEWTAGQITATLRETLQRPTLGTLTGIEVGRRGATGRVMAITIRHSGGVERIEGANPVRQALRPTSGGMLRSSDFSVQLGRGGALVAEGRGAGHGVGMCQWGTVGRARAGASWGEILAAYFPGAELGRLY